MAITKISPSVVDFDAGITITVDDNSDALTLTSTDADATLGPVLNLYRNSSSPADNDVVGSVKYVARNDNSQDVTTFTIQNYITDVSDGTEDAASFFYLMEGGSLRERLGFGSSATVFNEDGVNVDFRVESDGNTHRLFVDAGQDTVLLGTTASRNLSGVTPALFQEGTSYDLASLGLVANTNAANGAYLMLGTSRGTSNGSSTIVQDGDELGGIFWHGADGTDIATTAGYITVNVDGTPGSNDMPGSMRFATTADGASSATERMRIHSGGEVTIGDSSAESGAYASAKTLFLQGGESVQIIKNTSASDSSHRVAIGFLNSSGTGVGYISNNSSATAFITSSDHRLKENVTYDWDALTRLRQLKPARFNFKVDSDNTVDGFLAHEAQAIVPEAVTGTHNETKDLTNVVLNEFGNVIAEGVTEDDWKDNKISILWTKDDLDIPEGVSVGDVRIKSKYAANTTWKAEHTKDVYQGIDQSKLVPLLVKAVQELEAKVKALEEA
tara:strand:- start:890 stop:2389 length:1500 start_codon:yes stop_codon:yes gene_type:complete